jgi:hypothetical protein
MTESLDSPSGFLLLHGGKGRFGTRAYREQSSLAGRERPGELSENGPGNQSYASSRIVL